MRLALCKKIIEHYGGQMWAESAPGGATFYFTVPAAGRESEETATTRSHRGGM